MGCGVKFSAKRLSTAASGLRLGRVHLRHGDNPCCMLRRPCAPPAVVLSRSCQAFCRRGRGEVAGCCRNRCNRDPGARLADGVVGKRLVASHGVQRHRGFERRCVGAASPGHRERTSRQPKRPGLLSVYRMLHASGLLGSIRSKNKISSEAKFRDEAGNDWVGRGPRPLWLRTALANGKQRRPPSSASPNASLLRSTPTAPAAPGPAVGASQAGSPAPWRRVSHRTRRGRDRDGGCRICSSVPISEAAGRIRKRLCLEPIGWALAHEAHHAFLLSKNEGLCATSHNCACIRRP